MYQLAQHTLPQFERLEQELHHLARGQQGLLRIGMECHPCYQWLLTVVEPYLQHWALVDVDVKQQFQFKGAEALLHDEVDVLITPDPIERQGLQFIPVFPYEQVLVVGMGHSLAGREIVYPSDLTNEILITYPVPKERLDIFQQFLWQANLDVRQHKTLETTEIILQMVASNRGVTALPHWLLKNYPLPLKALRLGNGIFKYIHLGIRESDQMDYLWGFIELAKQRKQE